MIWKDIPGYEGLYQVSDCGQVKSFPRQGAKERILKPRLDKGGYNQVGLWNDGKVKKFLVHRLVALAFLEGDNSLTVNHIDECKTNNHVSNLEYLTREDNIRVWNKNNPNRRSEISKKGNEVMQEVHGQQVLDTLTGKTFPSIRAASRYMYEKEGATYIDNWRNKIRLGKQDRFELLNN